MAKAFRSEALKNTLTCLTEQSARIVSGVRVPRGRLSRRQASQLVQFAQQKSFFGTNRAGARS